MDASSAGEGFTVALASGETVTTRQILLATGMVDELPETVGVRERWGTGVHHCPYCHGWELRDGHIGILAPGGEPFAELRVTLLRGWSSNLTLLTDGSASLDRPARQRLEALGARIDERRLRAYEDGPDGGYRVCFEDGEELPVAGLFVAPSQHQRSGLAETLGCGLDTAEPNPAPFVVIDSTSGETTVSGVYAAGDLTGPAQSVILAAAGGARAAYFMNHALAAADAQAALTAAGLPAGSDGD